MKFTFDKKISIITTICCTTIICISLSIFYDIGPKHNALQTLNTNWGLSFQESGKPPQGNATADFLSKYNSYFAGNADSKDIYLTFDAGFENGFTPQILDILKKHQVHAAFFLVGNYLNTEPDLVKRMVSEGHTVGNHTYHHPDMSKISNIGSFTKEINDLETQFKEITGQDMPKFYRPPQGKYSEDNLKMAQQLGYKTIFWSLAYVDWYTDKQPTHEEAFKKLLPRMHNGAIILLHSTSKTNADILDELITQLKDKGYVFRTLDNLSA